MPLSDRYVNSTNTEIRRIRATVQKHMDQIAEIQSKIYPLEAAIAALEEVLAADAEARAEMGTEEADDASEPVAETE